MPLSLSERMWNRVKLRNLKYLLQKPFDEAVLIYNVESELIKWARLHAEFYIQRYEEEPEKHWKKGEKRNTFLGLMGQKIFDVVLQQLGVPKDHNDPVIDWRLEKDYDFKVPDFGTIEVKCFDYWHEKVLIKVSEWHHNDYAVIFKFVDQGPTEVQMRGWLTREQVESLPISRKGQTKYTPLADAYITDFDKLNPSNKFIKMLGEISVET